MPRPSAGLASGGVCLAGRRNPPGASSGLRWRPTREGAKRPGARQLACLAPNFLNRRAYGAYIKFNKADTHVSDGSIVPIIIGTIVPVVRMPAVGRLAEWYPSLFQGISVRSLENTEKLDS